MTKNLKALATLALAMTVTVSYAQSTAGSPPKHSVHHRKADPKKPSVESQIDELRQEMESQRGQIDTLKQQLSDRDAQLQQAQQAAQQAQQAAEAAQKAASDEQETLSSNKEAVSSLQTSVDDLKSSSSAFQVKIQKQADEVKKAVESPDGVHYKGITISPAGSFIEAATTNRTAATGGGINTPLTGIPLEHSDEGQIPEFHASARQSRIALTGKGKAGDLNITVHYEMDWLGTGITSNNNQSNSYVVRVRNMWARGEFDNGWGVTGGQTWSLATETTKLLEAGTEILPGTIDPQYTAGFVWGRQYGFRVTKNWGKTIALGFSAENAQALAGGSNGSNQIIGASGVGGGLYNSTATYSFNRAPDVVAKMAYDGWGHWELFGIARFFSNRIYPNATAATPSTAGAYNNTVTAGGVGGGFRVPFANKKVSLGLKGLYGEGVGRYGNAGIVDLAFRKDGTITPVHTFSALSTLEFAPTKRLSIWMNYGGDYAYRDLQGGYGSYTADMSGCNTEALPSGSTSPGGTGTCKGNNKDVQEFSGGYWYNLYKGPKGNFRYGLQYSYFERNLWSGMGGPLNPLGGAKGTDNEVETSFRYYLP